MINLLTAPPAATIQTGNSLRCRADSAPSSEVADVDDRFYANARAAFHALWSLGYYPSSNLPLLDNGIWMVLSWQQRVSADWESPSVPAILEFSYNSHSSFGVELGLGLVFHQSRIFLFYFCFIEDKQVLTQIFRNYNILGANTAVIKRLVLVGA